MLWVGCVVLVDLEGGLVALEPLDKLGPRRGGSRGRCPRSASARLRARPLCNCWRSVACQMVGFHTSVADASSPTSTSCASMTVVVIGDRVLHLCAIVQLDDPSLTLRTRQLFARCVTPQPTATSGLSQVLKRRLTWRTARETALRRYGFRPTRRLPRPFESSFVRRTRARILILLARRLSATHLVCRQA